jgi:hypothetical protein
VVASILLSACGASSVPSPSASVPAPATEIELGLLKPGRYTFTEFEPTIIVEVGEGWEGAHRFEEFWDVVRGDPTALIAVQFSRPTLIYGPAFGLETEAAADALAAWPDNRGLAVGEPVTATVDDLIGTQIDLTNETDSSVNVWGGPEGDLGLSSGMTLRVVILETDDRLLLISRQGPTESFDEALELTAPVFDSIRIGE